LEIPPERVEALPEARLCIKCSQEVGGEFEVKFTQENLRAYPRTGIVVQASRLPAGSRIGSKQAGEPQKELRQRDAAEKAAPHRTQRSIV
jgi:hypothetical protein